jgi:hypothetical protein
MQPVRRLKKTVTMTSVAFSGETFLLLLFLVGENLAREIRTTRTVHRRVKELLDVSIDSQSGHRRCRETTMDERTDRRSVHEYRLARCLFSQNSQ